MAENGVEYDPETVISREIHLDGKNICRVNGTLVNVTSLHKLGIQLINIHGQHDSAALFDEENHLAFLDAFADNGKLRASYGERYEAVAKLRREISALTMDEGEKLRRMENLKYQIAEIEKAELEPGEDDRLEERRKVLQNAEKLSNGMEIAVECLYGGEDSDGASGLLAQAEYALARAVPVQRQLRGSPRPGVGSHVPGSGRGGGGSGRPGQPELFRRGTGTGRVPAGCDSQAPPEVRHHL